MKRRTISSALAVAAAAAFPAASGADGGLSVSAGIAVHDERGPGIHEGSDWGERGRGWRETGPAWRYGYDRGWRDGSGRGHRDARRGRGFDLRRHDDFRAADNGYRGWMGSRRAFSSGYREGFAAGYRRAYLAARPSSRDHGRWRWDKSRDWYRHEDRR